MEVVLNVISVIILFGPAYLANTGAMLFGKWIPDILKFQSHKIDFGRNWYDGNRVLGDGKSWEGLFGGAVFSAVLTVLAHTLWGGRTTAEHRPLLDPVGILPSESFAYYEDPIVSAAIIGFTLGFSCMLGDSIGSFFKRRRGLKRERGNLLTRPSLGHHTLCVSHFRVHSAHVRGHDLFRGDREAICHRIANSHARHAQVNQHSRLQTGPEISTLLMN